MSSAQLAAHRAVMKKKNNRLSKKKAATRSRVAAMPQIPRVILEQNYVNPITLGWPIGVVVYEIKNRTTGRTNYYNKATFKKLITAFKNDYNLMMMNPKEPIPGAKNPMTRNPIYPRNVRRVTVAVKKKTPSPKTAVKKIQSAVRKHLSKKRKTPSTSKSKSKSRSK
jgi:hypothetical protein